MVFGVPHVNLGGRGNRTMVHGASKAGGIERQQLGRDGSRPLSVDGSEIWDSGCSAPRMMQMQLSRVEPTPGQSSAPQCLGKLGGFA